MPVRHDHRTQGAGPQTVHRLERELPVGGRLARLDPQLLLKRLRDPRTALHVAGGSQTDGDEMLAPGLQAEGPVESGHAVNVHQGASGFLGNLSQLVFGKVSIPCLDPFQQADETFVIAIGLL